MVAALLEVLSTVVVFPTAASSPGLAVLFVDAWALWLLPVVLVGAPLELVLRRLGRSRDEEVWCPASQDALVFLLALVLGTLALATFYGGARGARAEDFPAAIDRVRHLVAGGLVALAVVAAPALRRAMAWLVAQSPGLGTPSRVAAFVASALGLLGLGVAQFGLFAFHLPRFAAAAGVASALALMAAVRWAWPRPSMRAQRIAAGALLLAVVWPFVPVVSPHARFVLFMHLPTSGWVAMVLRDAADRDGDGAAPRWLGGTDCAEGDASRGPTLVERAADGVDQDCRGGDAVPPESLPRARPPAGCAPRPGASILLITIDALRVDAVDPAVTPNLVALASSAHVYTRAYAPATHTRPTTQSLFAARPLSDLRGDNILFGHLDLGQTLPARLQAAGYKPAAFNLFRLDPETQAGFPDYNAYPWDLSPHGAKADLNAAAMTNAALSFMANPKARPFFVWAHYPDAHAPYVVAAADRAEDSPRAAYERGLRYVDEHLGRLLRQLGALGLADETILAVSSDHGEDLGQRGRAGHGAHLFDETIHVPLFVRIPGCGAGPVETPVSLTGLGPSLVAAAGLSFEGRGLTHPDLAVVVETTYDGEHRRAVITAEGKLIHDVRNGGRMVFSARDGAELDNRDGEDVDLTETLDAAYQSWLDRPGRR